MMYPPEMVAPMRGELTQIGFSEMLTAADVDSLFEDAPESTLVVINSICGCSAGGCRPAVKFALEAEKKPAKLVTVFAGQDTEATAKMREYITGYAPSSPMIVLFKGKEPVFALERHQIEGRHPQEIGADLSDSFARLL